ncbi:hypothetical protein [Sphingobacterium endophyticum]|uniref:hypothetical protein n=1 Tax=Sphingobacterium endophyticum TaxID=2546448 RepID=UPI0012E1B684|nr:hypothetical protein [Sphingobacterium endophyticum]
MNKYKIKEYIKVNRSVQSAKWDENERLKTIKLIAEIVVQNVLRRYMETDYGIWGHQPVKEK